VVRYDSSACQNPSPAYIELTVPACDYTVRELKEGKYLVEALTRLSHGLSNYHSKAFSDNKES
jgi:hypothetical protein